MLSGEDISVYLQAISGLLVVAATVGLVTRICLSLLHRIWTTPQPSSRRPSLSLEQLLITFNWLVAICFAVTTLKTTHIGLGKHWESFDSSQTGLFMRLMAVQSVLYNISVTCSKIAVAMAQCRLFSGLRPHIVPLNRILMGVTVVYFITLVVTVSGRCIPKLSPWRSQPQERCFDIRAFSWTIFCCSMAIDLVLFGQLLAVLCEQDANSWSHWRVINISVLFLGGLLTCFIAPLRQVAINRIGQNTTYDLGEPIFWSSIVIMILFICCCILPTTPNSQPGQLPRTSPRDMFTSLTGRVAATEAVEPASKTGSRAPSIMVSPDPAPVQGGEWGNALHHTKRRLRTQTTIEALEPSRAYSDEADGNQGIMVTTELSIQTDGRRASECQPEEPSLPGAGEWDPESARNLFLDTTILDEEDRGDMDR